MKKLILTFALGLFAGIMLASWIVPDVAIIFHKNVANMIITNIQTNEDAPENSQYYISGFDVEDRTFYGVNFNGIFQNQSGVKYDISTLMEGDILCIEYGSVQKKQNDIASLENNVTGELIGIKKIILIARAKNLTHTFKNNKGDCL